MLKMADAEHDTETLAAASTLSRVRRRPGRLVLRVLEGPEAGTRKVLVGRQVTIGRSSAAALVLDDPSVSSLHAEISILPSRIELRDLSSRNGVRIGDRHVSHVELKPGDRIEMGSCVVGVEALEDVEVDRSVSDQFGELFGTSESMRELFGLLEKLAAAPLDVLITGETGTGKELVARALHDCSPLRERPFVVLDCGCLPKTLAESALFGHVKGAFTGADDRCGAFERADGGVVFVDEIGELPLELQVKLLRVLDRREFSRVGEEGKLRRVDVRVVAATHRSLPELVAKGLFREDLYYRLARCRVDVPPLRERVVDVEPLARRFLAQLTEHVVVADDAVEALVGHSWPGNVRELRNVIECAGHLAIEGVVRATDLDLVPDRRQATKLEQLIRTGDYRNVHDEVDRLLLAQALSDCRGNLSQAAKRLGVSRKGLRDRLKRLGMYTIDERDD